MELRSPDRSVPPAAVALAMILAVNAVGALPSLLVGADTSWFERP